MKTWQTGLMSIVIQFQGILTMPLAFHKFFKQCYIIIHCSEIFIEQPSDLLARAQVWSNYKHDSTVKFLIGITHIVCI